MNLIKKTIGEMQEIIDGLYVSCSSCTKNMLLNRLRKYVSDLSMFVQGLQNDVLTPFSARQAASSAIQPERSLSPSFRVQRRDGNPAYVAVKRYGV
jgi:hypothetical protein